MKLLYKFRRRKLNNKRNKLELEANGDKKEKIGYVPIEFTERRKE